MPTLYVSRLDERPGRSSRFVFDRRNMQIMSTVFDTPIKPHHLQQDDLLVIECKIVSGKGDIKHDYPEFLVQRVARLVKAADWR